MQTLQVILDLLEVLAIGWLGTAVMFRLMGGPIPWPYPRHWRWGSATMEAAYELPEPLDRRLTRIDWLDYNLRRN